MMPRLFLAAAFAVGFVASAQAGATTPPVEKDVGATHVAKGCGAGFWRGPGGRCNPLARHQKCPEGYRLGLLGRRCWPD